MTEVLLLAMLERVNRDLALPFRFSLGALRRRADLAQDCRGIAMCATLAIQDLHGWARAFLPFELLRRMQAEWALRSASSLADQAAWRFRVSAGSLELTAEEQASIDPGDIVLYSPEPALLLPADDRAGWGAVLDAPRRLRLSARKKTDMPASTERPIPFRKLSLRFQVVVDEHELTLAEAEKLTPGAVLDLGRDPAEPIRLAVNGHVVGTGELIEIEGRMGVRILSWSRA